MSTNEKESDRRPSATTVHPLAVTVCRRLIRTHRYARIAWLSTDGPLLLPVAYLPFGDRLILRVAPSGRLAELCDRHEVVVELDEVDPAGESAWSVQVPGLAGVVPGSDTLVNRIAAERLPAWGDDTQVPGSAGLQRDLVVEIVPHNWHGRSTHPFPAAVAKDAIDHPRVAVSPGEINSSPPQNVEAGWTHPTLGSGAGGLPLPPVDHPPETDRG